MAGTSGQKLRLIYLLKFLEQNTDEEHPASAADIMEAFEREGVSCERKTLYDDIDALRLAGHDIVYRRPAGYYMAGRRFELPELKLLVDLVQASRFITLKKSRGLIQKLQSLCSRFEAEQLQRQVFVANRIKAANEGIYYNVDALYSAIAENSQVSFWYCEWGADRRLRRRRNGERYIASPWALAWDDENYYLIAFEGGRIKHYRVDKMQGIECTGAVREGGEQFAGFDTARYSRRVFGMFGGETRSVTFELTEHLIGVFIDRLGSDIPVWSAEGKLYARADVDVSAQFFGWLCGLGDGVKIVRPEQTAEEYLGWLQNIAGKYRENS